MNHFVYACIGREQRVRVSMYQKSKCMVEYSQRERVNKFQRGDLDIGGTDGVFAFDHHSVVFLCGGLLLVVVLNSLLICKATL